MAICCPDKICPGTICCREKICPRTIRFYCELCARCAISKSDVAQCEHSHNVNFCTLWSLCKIVNCKLGYFQCTLWTFEHLAEHAEGPFQVCVCWYSTNLSWIMTSQCSLSLRIIHLHCSLLEAISSAGSFRHLDTTCKWFYTSKPFAHCTVCSSLFGFKRCPR